MNTETIRAFTSRRPVAVAGATLLAAALSFAACGGGGGGEEQASGAPSRPAQQSENPTGDKTVDRADGEVEKIADRTASDGEAETETISVGKTFWHAGFKVDLGDATFTPTDLGGLSILRVLIDATITNESTADSRFDSGLSLSSGDHHVEGYAVEGGVVPGKAFTKDVFQFDVFKDFTFDDAVLSIGSSANNQAVVPLGGTGELVTREPRTIAVDSTATAGTLLAKVSGGDVRFDIPDGHRQVEKDKVAVTLRFSATSAGDQYGNGDTLLSDTFVLRLPDGTTVAADEAPIEGLDAGTTISDLFVRFIVDSPASGEYVLVLRSGDQQGEMRFALP